MHADPCTRLPRSIATASALVLALVTAACNRDAQQEATGDVGAATTPPATATTEAVRVADVELGRSINATDKRIADRTEEFRARDTVYVSVHTTGSAPSTNVMARWTFEDGQVVDEATQTISPTGDAYTEFHITRPGGLPAGKYRVEVFLNGQSASTKEFTVK